MRPIDQQTACSELCLASFAGRTSAIGVLLLMVLTLTAPAARSQGNQGTLEGSVLDQSGAAVPGAKLTASNDATAIKFEATTDSNGLFFFPVVPVGTYIIVVEHSGFTKLTQKMVHLPEGVGWVFTRL